MFEASCAITVKLNDVPLVAEAGAKTEKCVAAGVAVLTMSVTVAECTRLPLEPLTVSVEVPAAVALPLETVRVEVPAPVIVAGEKLPVTPDGSPVTLRVTAPEKLEIEVVLMV